MLSDKEITSIYQTIISSPGMQDHVKLSFNMTRKNVLLLVKLLEQGQQLKEGETSSLLQALQKDGQTDLSGIIHEMLDKAGLTDMYQNLQSLQSKN
ncbi:hypothetical protein [Pinibacter aurantiacus]|jgi:hypothetical protein|uniref:Uncharacterized protein n=1 Tax=Pinibacter aurantiacus TaxID=2851599 RepID=A0A9E2W3P2_9BACT|nr:hypothetical protein [Pinibacter aurantiacus]MBV4358770.1 hypothetical protein [Pinibacter aurantiacus]